MTFDLPAETKLGRADFFVSPANATALAAIDGWRNWPAGRMLLVGPDGAGKTHLARIWASETGAAVVPATGLAGADLPSLAANTAVAVEDAERLAGNPSAETAMFHLHNLLADSGALLVTANAPPRDWGLGLPDLASRMQAISQTRLDLPDDALLSAVLAKLFSDRQISVPETLIPYLVVRMDRSITAARALVAELDAFALSLSRPITRQLAAEFLGITDSR